MGCAYIVSRKGIDLSSHQDKFNGDALELARKFNGYDLDELSKISGIRRDHLIEIETGLCQPTDYEIFCILEVLTSHLSSFYYCQTYIKEPPDIYFVCGPGITPCANCGQVADFLCDYPVGDGKTCDLPICAQCRTHVGKYDFCPIHVDINRVIKVF